jgi:hypothetical protein
VSDEERQRQEWEALYFELKELLSGQGKEDPYGNGDFWIVDDNYGSPQHKVCVFEVSFITQPLALEVQRLLRKHSLAWEVLFAFDKPDPRRDPNDLGISVHKPRSRNAGMWNEWKRHSGSNSVGGRDLPQTNHRVESDASARASTRAR